MITHNSAAGFGSRISDNRCSVQRAGSFALNQQNKHQCSDAYGIEQLNFDASSEKKIEALTFYVML